MEIKFTSKWYAFIFWGLIFLLVADYMHEIAVRASIHETAQCCIEQDKITAEKEELLKENFELQNSMDKLRDRCIEEFLAPGL